MASPPAIFSTLLFRSLPKFEFILPPRHNLIK